MVGGGTDDVEHAFFREPDFEEISSSEIDDLEVVWLVGRCARSSFAAEREIQLRVGDSRNGEDAAALGAAANALAKTKDRSRG